MKKPSLFVIFVTVLIDLIGFGIVLPLLPIISRNYGASGLVIGLIMASYSAMQFLFSPIWGRISDRVGRRPILLLSTAFASVSYIVFALGCRFDGWSALVIFFASRILAGICGANITVAQAYIADISPPELRTRRMGMIGMAFGLGFIIGPALGSLSVARMGPEGPGWVAALLCAINFLSAFFFLSESLTERNLQTEARPRLKQFGLLVRHPTKSLLVGIFFLSTFCFTCFETTLGLIVGINFNLDMGRAKDAEIIGYLFTFGGLIGALAQGGLIGRLTDAFGEARVIAWSLILVGVSMAPLPLLTSWPGLLLALAMLSIGSSLARPPVFGLLSKFTRADEQGATLGLAQSAGSMARIAGPIFAGSLYQAHPVVPYLICAVLAVFTGIGAWRYLSIHKPGDPDAVEGTRS